MTDKQRYAFDAACYAQGQAALYASEAVKVVANDWPELAPAMQAQAARWADLAQHWLSLLLAEQANG